MWDPQSNTFHVWVLSSALSIASSSLLLIYLLWNQQHWKKMFHQLSAFLAVLDLITSGSWFIGAKYRTSYRLCCTQEYLFQGGLLCKGMTTAVICYLSTRVIQTMQIPPQAEVLRALVISNLLGLLFLIASIFFKSADIFCTHSDLNNASNSTIAGYFYFVMLPLYLCVLIDLLFFALIRYHLYIDRPSASASALSLDQALLDHTTRLLRIVRKLLFYPLLFGLCLLPEAVLLLLNIFSVQMPGWLFLLASASMGLMGFAVSVNYFRRLSRTNSAPSEPFSAPKALMRFFRCSSDDSAAVDGGASDRGPPGGLIMGRNLSSILRWGSSATAESTASLTATHGHKRGNTDQLESGIDLTAGRPSTESMSADRSLPIA